MVNTIYPEGLPAGQNRIAGRSLDLIAKSLTPANPNEAVKASKAPVEVEAASVINVYPNPFIDVIKVDMTSTKQANVNIVVYDMNGKMIFRSNGMNIMKGNNIISTQLPVGLKVLPGNYVISIWVDGKLTKSVKLIKAN